MSCTIALFCGVSAMPSAAQTTDGAQTPPPGPQPLPDMPEIGVPWPDLEGREAQAPVDTGQEITGANLRYTVEVRGLEGVDLEDRFRETSALEEERGDPATAAQINRRAREDTELIRRLLESEGYYAGEVDAAVTAVPDAPGRVHVAFTVTPGPRYHFSDVGFVMPPDAPEAFMTELFPLKAGDPIAAVRVEAAEDQLRLELPMHGYPFAEVGERDILLDDEAHTGIYSLRVKPGPITAYGGFRLEGDRLFDERHVQVLARFRPGETYDSREIEDLRQAMVATGLFSRVAIRPVLTGEKTPDGRSVTDLAIDTRAGPQRRLAFSGGYATGEGFRVEGRWLHRNLLPPEGAVTFRAVGGTQEQRLAAEMNRNNAGQRDRTFNALVEASNESRDAYHAYALTLAARLQRQTNIIWQKKWTYSVGAELLITNQRDRSLFAGDGDEVVDGPRRTYVIASVPGQLGYDGTDDLLDPSRGFRITGRLSPELALQSGVFGYTRLRLDMSGYLPLKEDKTVLAGRVAAGTIFGADRDRIAPSRRFYSGGGGSVRGFGYQELGPRDADGDPLGGRSLAEASVELRHRFDGFGIAAFVDAGQVYRDALPRFTGLRFGAGIGARYYTGFGPIRLDVATPLSRRNGDPKIAVYVSIGQAF